MSEEEVNTVIKEAPKADPEGISIDYKRICSFNKSSILIAWFIELNIYHRSI